MNVDPLAEKNRRFSTYAYCVNNPVFFIDPDGMMHVDPQSDINAEYVKDASDFMDDPPIGVDAKNGAVHNDDKGEWVYDEASTTWLGQNGAKNLYNRIELNEVVVKGYSKRNSSDSSTPWMDTASSQIGVKEIFGSKNNSSILNYHSTTGGFNNDETAWCSSFVNWSFKQNEIKGTNSAMALSWKNWGQNLGENPAYGSVAVFSYGGGKGHVGFVAGQNSSGKLIILGGNQSDQVKYSAFGTSQLTRFVYPNGYKPNYTLPLMNIKGNSSIKSTR